MADFTGDDPEAVVRLGRVKMRPADPAGFREAWDTVERLWDPLDLPWDEMRDTPGVPRDRAARSFPVRECLLVVLNEEWEHRLYAERDLAALEARQREDADGRPLPA